jgi:hypothetical protein
MMALVEHDAVKRVRFEAQRLHRMYGHRDPVRAATIVSIAERASKNRTAGFQLNVWRDACADLRALGQNDGEAS